VADLKSTFRKFHWVLRPGDGWSFSSLRGPHGWRYALTRLYLKRVVPLWRSSVGRFRSPNADGVLLGHYRRVPCRRMPSRILREAGFEASNDGFLDGVQRYVAIAGATASSRSYLRTAAFDRGILTIWIFR
jgi:hypothetical protein